MILKTQALWFLVLVPHRDVRLLLRGWSASLFKAGFCGAYHFPWVVPVANLNKPLKSEELKQYARDLREESLLKNRGKITSQSISCLTFPLFERLPQNKMKLFGPCLDLALPENVFCPGAAAKIERFFSPLLIGACLVHNEEKFVNTILPPAPEISFRAAALANMSYMPMNIKQGNEVCDSYKWEIGKLAWLPKRNLCPAGQNRG